MATADKAEFDNRKRTITLTGGPARLWQGPDVMVGDTIIIYIDKNLMEFRSDDKGEIRAIINPAKKKREPKSTDKEN
jgi:lipopolysaccharide export system protein LptA